jgi:hypothetical protein
MAGLVEKLVLPFFCCAEICPLVKNMKNLREGSSWEHINGVIPLKG